MSERAASEQAGWMPGPMAFVQVDADKIFLASGRLRPVPSPRAGATLVLAPHFSLDEGKGFWLDAAESSSASLDRAAWSGRFGQPSAAPPPICWSVPDEERFRRGFNLLARRLQDGSLRKGVPVTLMRAPLAEADAAVLFEHLVSRVAHLPDTVIAYGLFLPPDATGGSAEFMIGATPEVLFDIDDAGGLTTMAVAGTRPAAVDAATLADSAKDRDEHSLVVDDLVERLRVWGRVEAYETGTRTFGELRHLFAEIRLAPREPLDFDALVRRLHPTPALGVYPRGNAGAAWLAMIDPKGERRRFGGPFGVRYPSGAGRALVAIRNLQYHDGFLEIWAGCGVVGMSRYEEEWEEVLDKMREVRSLWGV